MTRIMHVVYGLGRGGLQTGMENLFGRLDRNRFEHVICALRPPIDHPMCQGLSEYARLMCLNTTDSGSRFQLSAIAKAIREVKPDIVHSRNWGCIEAVLAGRWAGSCALVHGEHGIDTDIVDREPRRRTWFRRVAFEMADRVLAVSHQLGDLHAQRTGFSRDRITVIHNGVNESRFARNARVRESIRRELGLAGDEFCVGSVGNLATVKDYMTALKGIAEMAGTVGKWRFVVIGDGPERPRLEAYIDSQPALRGRVSLMGWTMRVTELLNAFDVFVLSSVTEGICNSLLEAMATSLPVVATATGGNPEVVVDGVSGLLFPVGDSAALAEKLKSLHRQSDRREQLGREALLRVRNEFSTESMAGNYERVYSSLIRSPVRTPDALRVSG